MVLKRGRFGEFSPVRAIRLPEHQEDSEKSRRREVKQTYRSPAMSVCGKNLAIKHGRFGE